MFHRDSKGHVAALVGSHMTKIMIYTDDDDDDNIKNNRNNAPRPKTITIIH